MTKRRVVVTGVGLVTPLGTGTEKTWSNICAGNSGVGRELSQWFLDEFTESKLICFDLGGERVDRRAAGGW